MTGRRSILAVLYTDMTCYRELVLGVSDYGNTEGNWHLKVVSPATDFLEVIVREKPQGLLLGAAHSVEPSERAAGMMSNCVGVCAQHASSGLLGLAEVESDDVGVGRMGARHFLEKGFTQFGFVGQYQGPWSDRRWEGFSRELKEAGHFTSLYLVGWEPGLLHNLSLEPEAGDLRAWLVRQPKPLAIFACNDRMGGSLIRLCGDLGLRVPDDVAVLGVDNDDMECAMCNPPLSSVVVPWRRLGRKAASLLDQLIDGRPVPRIAHLIPPGGIAERQSTDVVALNDPEARTALRYIREHAGKQITVDDVVREVSITRRRLERKFRALLGRTPLEEIRNAHVERAKTLLAQTDLPIKEIARQSGFASATWFSKAFKSIAGVTPADYRKEHHQKGG